MALAQEHALKTLAFSAISCGVYGYPTHAAARIAVDEIVNALANASSVDKVILVAFNESVAASLRSALGRSGSAR
jgi:O-acetyl-ADP-ribose deacetylase (regulator of RNase III)